MNWVALVMFVAVQLTWIAIFIAWWRDREMPFPPSRPQGVFHLVHREDRAAYVRIMRRTTAVQMRDMGRAMARLQRTLVKEFMPSIQRLHDALVAMFGGSGESQP